MAVKIGSARIDENGNAHGGKAGDQTAKEVSTQNWYNHSKGWVVLRPKDAEKAEKIAKAMQSACDNPHIGYDQYQRNTLFNAAKIVGYDPARVLSPVETDCSALVRVCCNFAGIRVGDFTTKNQISTMLQTGEFAELTDKRYTAQSAYLKRGDVLVTKTRGHTVVVLSDGAKVEADYALGDRELKRGMTGADVAQLQTTLIACGYDCGKWGADGDFGSGTEAAVKAMQLDAGLTVDGVYGANTHAALLNMGDAKEEETQTEGKFYYTVTGANVNLRMGPGTGYAKASVVHAGDRLEKAAADGWRIVKEGDEVRFISEKYVLEGIK